MRYCVIGLTSGEQVMCILRGSDETHTHISHPVSLKIVPSVDEEGEYYEYLSIQPFCQFTFSTDFSFPNGSVLFCSPLRPNLIGKYTRFIEQLDSELEELSSSNESEELDEIERTLDRIEQILDGNLVEEEIKSIQVPGNDTIH